MPQVGQATAPLVDRCPPCFRAARDEYLAACRRRGNAEASVVTKQRAADAFLAYLEEAGREALGQAQARDLAGFWARRQNRGYAPKTNGSLRSSLADFLRHLHQTGQIGEDLAGRLPPQRYPRRGQTAPYPWTAAQVRLVLDQIDRQSAIGKRDYAMIVLTARLGLRVGDLRRLEVGWFDWRAKTLALTQHKTGVALRLPVPGDVGWAVIDYIRHGRPEAGCAQVFLKHRYPFTAFGSSSSAGCRLRVLRAARRDHVPGAAVPRPALAARRPGGRDAPGRHAPAGGHGGPGSRRLPAQPPRTISGSTLSTCAAAPWTSKTSSTQGKEHVRERGDAARPDRHAGRGPPRRRVPVRLPRTGAAPVRRALPPGRIRRRLDRQGSRRGVPLRPPPQSRPPSAARNSSCANWPNTPASSAGTAWAPPALTAVKKPHRPPPYVFSDEEIRRLFRVIDTQPLSENSNRALVDPVLFRVFYGTGLRLSEALNLELRDFDPARGDPRDTRRQEPREPPRARHRAPGRRRWRAISRPPTPAPNPPPAVPHRRPLHSRRTSPRFTTGSAVTSPTPAFPISPGGPHIHSLRHGFAVANLRRWAAGGADLVVMLPYLSAYMGHADLRGTQYYLQLTADAHPEVAAMVTARFGYVIPGPAARRKDPGSEPARA